MFKRAMSNCASNCHCANLANRSFTMRMMSMYNDIGRYRKIDMGIGNEKGHEFKDQSWYKKAGARDNRMGKIIVIGSAIIGSAAVTTYQMSSRYYDYEEHIRQNMLMGGLLGGVAGAGLWLIYPFPSTIAALTGGALFFKFIPKYIADYAKDSNK